MAGRATTLLFVRSGRPHALLGLRFRDTHSGNNADGSASQLTRLDSGRPHWSIVFGHAGEDARATETLRAVPQNLHPTTLTSVPIGGIVMRMSSPSFRVNESGGTTPVPVN